MCVSVCVSECEKCELTQVCGVLWSSEHAVCGVHVLCVCCPFFVTGDTAEVESLTAALSQAVRSQPLEGDSISCVTVSLVPHPQG